MPHDRDRMRQPSPIQGGITNIIRWRPATKPFGGNTPKIENVAQVKRIETKRVTIVVTPIDS
jgi:hypothetical protein